MTQHLMLVIALFAALVISAALYHKSVILKFLAISFVVLIANMIYFAFDGAKGWPAEEKDDVKGMLASVVIVNPSENNEGAIYIGLFPSTPYSWWEYKYPRLAPKTFYVKYSNDRASKFEEAKQAMNEGKEVRINGIPPENFQEGEEASNIDSMEEGMIGAINGLIQKLLPKKQKDTYTPKVSPDVEIITPELPQKGTGQ